MRLNLYSIHDKLMNVYLAPFAARGNVDACRQITASLSDPQMAQSAIALSPQDYMLVRIGEFDDESGDLIAGFEVIKSLRDLKADTRTVST